ncbi:MAG TPA: DUF1616 domain-containing protein, partial [Nitrososphaerales archaeon]|nr:DUF1616 domain-containing protein [Nitrososphaerales archaeon]
KLSPAEDRTLKKLEGREVPASALVAELGQDGMKRDDAIGAIISLHGSKKLSVEEARPYATLWSYAISPYSLWFWGALLAVVASMGLTAVSSGVVIYARYVFGSALVFFFPGYALIEALYPKRELDELTRFALSIGLSLAVVPLTGLVLNYTPFGIRLLPVTLSIAGLTVIFLCTAVYRKHQYYKLSKGVG